MSPPDARRTRGKSNPGRLDQQDAWLLAREAALLAGPGAPVVDLGVGSVPWTTVSLAEAVAPIPVIGVEADPERVRSACRHAHATLRFVQGGFDLGGVGPVRLLRAMNLLRQYPPERVPSILAALRAHLTPGGLLLEGTSSKKGEVWVARRLRPDRDEGLVFGLDDPTRGTAPQRFWPYLPRGLGHRTTPGLELRSFCRAWERAFAEASSSQHAPSEHFAVTVARVGQDWPLVAGPIAGTAELAGA